MCIYIYTRCNWQRSHCRNRWQMSQASEEIRCPHLKISTHTALVNPLFCFACKRSVSLPTGLHQAWNVKRTATSRENPVGWPCHQKAHHGSEANGYPTQPASGSLSHKCLDGGMPDRLVGGNGWVLKWSSMIDNHTRLKQTFKTYHIMLHKGLIPSVIVTS